MAKTLTIRIKSAEEALKGFGETFKTVESGRRVRRTEGVYFARIYELAKTVGRDLKNVQDDLRLLERYGLVEMRDGRKTGRRRVRTPKALFHQIALKIAI